MVTPDADLERLLEGLCDGLESPGELLVASDFDGTIAPVVATPGAARALPDTVAALRRLVTAGVRVAVISGRAVDALAKVLPVDGITLLGDYGLEAPDERERDALARFNERVLAEFVDVAGVVVEPKPGSTSVHYRDNPAAGERVYRTLAPLAEDLGLRAGQGRMVVEVRPHRADKGLALRRLLERERPRAVVFAGDDEGDRSAFAVCRAHGDRHLAVGVWSPEVASDLFADCDAVIEGPARWSAILDQLSRRLVAQ